MSPAESEVIEETADLAHEIADTLARFCRCGGGAVSPGGVRQHCLDLCLHAGSLLSMAVFDLLDPFSECLGCGLPLLDKPRHLSDEIRHILQFQIKTEHSSKLGNAGGNA